MKVITLKVLPPHNQQPPPLELKRGDKWQIKAIVNNVAVDWYTFEATEDCLVLATSWEEQTEENSAVADPYEGMLPEQWPAYQRLCQHTEEFYEKRIRRTESERRRTGKAGTRGRGAANRRTVTKRA